MFNTKALMCAMFGGDEMYVVKPGTSPFKKDFVTLGGNLQTAVKKVTLNEDFFLYKAFEATSGYNIPITITYPSGDSFWVHGQSKDRAEELGIFLPRGTVISHQYNVGATGFYVVPARSIGGEEGGVNPYAKYRSPLRRAA